MQLDSNFFIEELHLGEVLLNSDESSHIAKSFRARAGDSLVLCDGKGSLAEAELLEPNPKACKALVKSIGKKEPQPKIHLAISCLSDNCEEDIAFHAAQFPLAAIHLLRTEKSLEPRESTLSKLCRRMEAKSLAALKQSRKSWLTEIKPPVFLSDFLKSFRGNLIVCDKDGETYAPPFSHLSPHIAILTGPEGGFSPAELEALRNQEAFFLSLGQTRLRAATAPLMALGIVTFSCFAKTA
ncbi:MAG: 16S rRNA (uracil(1498)-N(3))-methyltransferase [Fibromonadales bacterium]|nr:16S rRNA (uracil(1498)-N(3))-methyltransferase [Fibromonadales bacterium]